MVKIFSNKIVQDLVDTVDSWISNSNIQVTQYYYLSTTRYEEITYNIMIIYETTEN